MARINSKQKGNRNELECVKIFESYFGKGFARTPQSGGWSGGQNRMSREDMSIEQKLTLVSDIMTPPDFAFVLEHKAYEKMEFWDLFNDSSKLNEWVNQVSEDAFFVDREPMLIMKFNRKQRIVMVKTPLDKYQFIWKDQNNNNWYCDWFENVLNNTDNSFWFNK